jgi:uncharacterized protein (DUF302 family)
MWALEQPRNENAMTENGLVTLPCAHDAKTTLDRLEASLRDRGVTVFARIDHAAGAGAVGMDLRPTELLIFGAPRAGTPLMQDRQTIGLDLPMKALAWEDAEGRSWLTFNDVTWLARRHGVGTQAAPAVSALAATMEALARAAAS